MPSFGSLPNEILFQIVSQLTSRSDIGNVRLANRTLSNIAKRAYFASVCLYPEWEDDDDKPAWPNDTDYDVDTFKIISDDERIKPLVKSVDIYTCNPNCVS